MIVRHRQIQFLLIILSLVPTGLAESSKPVAETAEAVNVDPVTVKSDLADLLEFYNQDRSSLERHFGKLSSSRSRDRFAEFYRHWRDRLAEVDFASLNQAGKADHVLFARHLTHSLAELSDERNRRLETHPIVPFAGAIEDLAQARLDMSSPDARKLGEQINQLNKELLDLQKDLTKRLSEDKPQEDSPSVLDWKKTTVNRAVGYSNDAKTQLKAWFDYYKGYDPLVSWWVQKPYEEFNETLEKYSEFLRTKLLGLDKEDNKTIIGDPIGREALERDLRFEMIPYTPSELIDLAEKEFRWCEEEMLKASRELGFGEDWKAALEFVKGKHVEPGGQPEMIRELALEAIDYVESHDLVTIPPLAKETWRMSMMSPERQLVNPFFLGGEVIQVSYPTDTMTHEQKLMSMRGNNRHFSRATVQHELIPGHHLQGFMTRRYNAHRRIFSTPFWGEGWALYWELSLWDRGFPQTPEDRIGMLFWRMHRCARIVFSLSFHLERMTPQECVDMLVDRVGHERANAEGEVRRSFTGDYGPLYQAAYLLGGLQFRGLYRELVEGGRMTARDFHDAVLRLNRIPVEMVRALLTQQEIAPEMVSNWRFYEQE